MDVLLSYICYASQTSGYLKLLKETRQQALVELLQKESSKCTSADSGSEMITDCIGEFSCGRFTTKITCSILPFCYSLQHSILNPFGFIMEIQMAQHSHGTQEQRCWICQVLHECKELSTKLLIWLIRED